MVQNNKWGLKDLFKTIDMAAVIAIVLGLVCYWDQIFVKATDLLMSLY